MAGNEPLITLDTVVRRNNDNLLTSEVGEELVMMDMEGGNYISLNRMGRVIWEQMENPLPVGEMINILMTRFKVRQDVCTEDTLAYLQNMLLQKVICIAE